MKLTRFRALCAGAAVATTSIAIPSSLSAQETQRDQNRQQRDQDPRQRNQQQQDWEEQDNQRDQQGQRGDRYRSQGSRDEDRQGQNSRSNQRQSEAAIYQLDPRAWVTIGTDYNNDGQFDAFERIYLFDLERARTDSTRRQDQANRNQSSQRQGAGEQGQFPRTASVQGTITKLASVRMAGQNKQSRFAKLKTRDGKQLTVCLGPAEKLTDWQLEKGDQIQVNGVKARLNDRVILMATKVSHDGQSVSADLPKRSGLKRAKAELVSTRQVRFKNYDQPFVIGQVETQSGKQTLVNFGPAEKIQKLNLSEGDELRILARQGSINGREAMIAEEVRANGQTVRLERPQDRQRFQRSNPSQDQGGEQSGRDA